jgi:hypothetical protein
MMGDVISPKRLTMILLCMWVVSLVVYVILIRQFGALPSVQRNAELIQENTTAIHRLSAKMDSLRTWADSVR